MGPSTNRPAETAANTQDLDKLLIACAASVLRELARREGRPPVPHFPRVSGSLEAMRTLTLGLVHVARLRGLSPARMEQLATWIERAEPAVGEYLAVVDSRAIERDHTRVLRELGLQIGPDGRVRNACDLNGPALTWTETLRMLDGLELGLGRRHHLRFSDPTEPVS